MQLSRSLLGWYLRAARPATLLAAVLAALFTLLHPSRLIAAVFLPFIFITLHSVVSTRLMCRFDSPAAGFLYTRGFTRNRLWSHRIAAHLLNVLAVWGPASLIIWFGIRSTLQDHVFENPCYPLFKADDFAVPLWWLGGYLLLVGLVEYGPVRRAQPTLDHDAGYVIEFGLLLMLLMFLHTSWRNPWYVVPFASAFLVASVTLLVGSRRLHRQIEVRP
jgi:hypothetical protein